MQRPLNKAMLTPKPTPLIPDSQDLLTKEAKKPQQKLTPEQKKSFRRRLNQIVLSRLKAELEQQINIPFDELPTKFQKEIQVSLEALPKPIRIEKALRRKTGNHETFHITLATDRPKKGQPPRIIHHFCVGPEQPEQKEPEKESIETPEATFNPPLEQLKIIARFRQERNDFIEALNNRPAFKEIKESLILVLAKTSMNVEDYLKSLKNDSFGNQFLSFEKNFGKNFRPLALKTKSADTNSCYLLREYEDVLKLAHQYKLSRTNPKQFLASLPKPPVVQTQSEQQKPKPESFSIFSPFQPMKFSDLPTDAQNKLQAELKKKKVFKIISIEGVRSPEHQEFRVHVETPKDRKNPNAPRKFYYVFGYGPTSLEYNMDDLEEGEWKTLPREKQLKYVRQAREKKWRQMIWEGNYDPEQDLENSIETLSAKAKDFAVSFWKDSTGKTHLTNALKHEIEQKDGLDGPASALKASTYRERLILREDSQEGQEFIEFDKRFGHLMAQIPFTVFPWKKDYEACLFHASQIAGLKKDPIAHNVEQDMKKYTINPQ